MTHMADNAMREEIRRAVRDLEQTTEGEMVCVIANSSAHYLLFPLLWAALAALALPAVNPLVAFAGGRAFVDFSVQGLVFAGLALLFAAKPLRARVTPHRILDNVCHRAAFEQFYLRGMFDTKKRTGVLLYVSVLERYVGVLADEGIRARVKDAEWDELVKNFTVELRKGRIREGYLAAIAGARALLAAHFPEKREPVNELDDRLVELPESRLIN